MQQTAEGPFGTGPIECNGAGFWDKDGSWGEGICRHGTDEESRVSYWKRVKGQKAGQWKLLSGTGKYAGMTGQGTYVSTRLPEGRVVSEWEGEISLAQ